jgi:hypothetical protein
MKKILEKTKIGQISTFEKILNQLEKDIPPVVERCKLTKITGGAINSRTIANLMSRSDGPVGTRVGKKVLILRADLIEWLKRRYFNDINSENKN